MANTPHFLNVSPCPYVNIALLKADNAVCNKTQYHYNTKCFKEMCSPCKKKGKKKVDYGWRSPYVSTIQIDAQLIVYQKSPKKRR